MRGDCLEELRGLADCSVDAVVTDPPYGLSFMGKKWDYDVPSEDVWRECLRVLKPGGHLLAFAGTRTQHRMAVRIEDAGFEIRDMIAWVYGSGFPKSLDVSKAIDKAAGVDRLDAIKGGHMGAAGRSHGEDYINEGAAVIEKTIPAVVGKGALTRGTPITEAARQWQGWGTALKPALEPITVARKPFPGTVAANVLAHGTGGLNIDGCRVEGAPRMTHKDGNSMATSIYQQGRKYDEAAKYVRRDNPSGRWPANLIHDGSDEVTGLFPVTTSGSRKAGEYGVAGSDQVYGARGLAAMPAISGDTGSAARFFYCAKASKRDRDEGLEGFELQQPTHGKGHEKGWLNVSNSKNPQRNIHPTVKPTDLMRYLCRLITPPEGIVLDPFMGSGSTGKAALLEGFRFIGIERDEEYFKIAEARIATAKGD